jgi:tRNA uridine 5-carboxymethylaminomethyl modification enzyme
MLRRPEIDLAALARLAEQAELPLAIDLTDLPFREVVELQVKYEGYIRRQEEQVARFRKLERTLLPSDMEYTGLPGLSNEVVEKLNAVQPLSLGQASRISGMTPAAISVLQVHLKKQGHI